MPDQYTEAGGTLGVKIKVGATQYVKYVGVGAAVLGTGTGTDLAQDQTDNAISYDDGRTTYYLEIDAATAPPTIIFTTTQSISPVPWTESGTGSAARVQISSTEKLGVDPSGALIVDAAGTEAHIE